mgnify:CR=1 FL=1|jgi:hypothetical protein|nr:MAG TPA: hypothetical protein [Caudoviricetes sp.]
MGLFDKFIQRPSMPVDAGLGSPMDAFTQAGFNPMQEKNPINPLTANDTPDEANEYVQTAQANINRLAAPAPEIMHNADSDADDVLITAPQAVTPQGGDVPLPTVINDVRANQAQQAPMRPANQMFDLKSKEYSMKPAKVEEVKEPQQLKDARQMAMNAVQGELDIKQGFLQAFTPGGDAESVKRYSNHAALIGMIYNQVHRNPSYEVSNAIALYNGMVTEWGMKINATKMAYETNAAAREAIDAKIAQAQAFNDQLRIGAGDDYADGIYHAKGEHVNYRAEQGALAAFADKDKAKRLQDAAKDTSARMEKAAERVRTLPARAKSRVMAGVLGEIWSNKQQGLLDVGQAIGMINAAAEQDELWSDGQLAYANQLTMQYGFSREGARRAMAMMAVPELRSMAVSIAQGNAAKLPGQQKEAMAALATVFNSRDIANIVNTYGTVQAFNNNMDMAVIARGTPLMKNLTEANDSLLSQVSDTAAARDINASVAAATTQVVGPDGRPVPVSGSLRADQIEVALEANEKLKNSKNAGDRVLGKFFESGINGVDIRDAHDVLIASNVAFSGSDAAVANSVKAGLGKMLNQVNAGIPLDDPEVMKDLQALFSAVRSGKKKMSEKVLNRIQSKISADTMKDLVTIMRSSQQLQGLTPAELTKERLQSAQAFYLQTQFANRPLSIPISDDLLPILQQSGYLELAKKKGIEVKSNMLVGKAKDFGVAHIGEIVKDVSLSLAANAVAPIRANYSTILTETKKALYKDKENIAFIRTLCGSSLDIDSLVKAYVDDMIRKTEQTQRANAAAGVTAKSA